MNPHGKAATGVGEADGSARTEAHEAVGVPALATTTGLHRTTRAITARLDRVHRSGAVERAHRWARTAAHGCRCAAARTAGAARNMATARTTSATRTVPAQPAGNADSVMSRARECVEAGWGEAGTAGLPSAPGTRTLPRIAAATAAACVACVLGVFLARRYRS